jgi:aspartokinase
MTERPVTSLSVTYNVALVTVDKLPNDTKIISELFSSIAERGINIDMISQAPPYRGSVCISFSLLSKDLVNTLNTLNEFKKNAKDIRIEIDAYNTKLQVFGEGMKSVPGVAARLFTLLAENDIDIKLVTTSETDISYLIFEKDVDRAVNAIKQEYQIE